MSNETTEKNKEPASDEKVPKSDNPGMLDQVQEKIVSRKLLVFVTATVLMWHGLDPNTWGMIAMCYIGGQSVIDFAKVWKGGM